MEEPQEAKLGIAALSAFTEASLVQGTPPKFAVCEVISPLQMGAVMLSPFSVLRTDAGGGE